MGGANNDPISSAKQYSYVRKFSVDISALQAQLQNPKIFKDAPFQSDMDLTKKSSGEGGGVGQTGKIQPEPLLPLKPLPLKLEGKGGGGGGGLEISTPKQPTQRGTPPPAIKNGPSKPTPSSLDIEKPENVPISSVIMAVPAVQTPPQPPPPVIMVSNDEDTSNLQIDGEDLEGDNTDQHGDETTPLNREENTTGISCTKDLSPSTSSPSTVDNIAITTSSPPAKKPTSLAFKDSSRQLGQQQKDVACDDASSCENHIKGATLDSDLSYASGDGDDGERATAIRMSQLVLLLTSTFLLALLPVAITELLRDRLSSATFVNTRACVVAVWALQTLVYPHLLAWGDRNLHRAVRRLKRSFTATLEDKLGAVCCTCCCPQSGESRRGHIEDTSSVSQV